MRKISLPSCQIPGEIRRDYSKYLRMFEVIAEECEREKFDYSGMDSWAYEIRKNLTSLNNDLKFRDALRNLGVPYDEDYILDVLDILDRKARDFKEVAKNVRNYKGTFSSLEHCCN
jgi:hypothetical protein